MSSRPARRFARRFVLLSAFLIVAACGSGGGGGGGGSGGDSSGGSSEVNSVTGSFLAGTGAGLPGVAVSLDTLPATVAFTDADGHYTLSAVPGAYHMSAMIGGIEAFGATVVVKKAGKPATDLGAIQLTTTVLGSVVDGLGGPVSGALVEVGGALAFAGGDGSPLQASTTTDASGAFSFELPDGDYVYAVTVNGVALPPAPFEVAIQSGTVQLEAVQGLVAVQGQLLDGLLFPLAGCAVQVETSPPVVVHTDEDGLFTANVPAGVYTARVLLDGMLLDVLEVEAPGPAPTQLGSLQVLARVTGRVIDDLLAPVEGAEIVVDTAPLTITESLADGTFTMDLPFADLSLSVRLFGVTVEQLMLDADTRNMSAGVFPLLPFTGVIQIGELTVNLQADSDGDGLGDALESDGWDILVDEFGDGLTEARHVYGHPTQVDFDQDGLEDDAEFLARTDPREADTDHDLLDDRDELERFKSNPVSVDTDGDARALDADGQPTGLPNPSLFDGFEYAYSHTSPTLADTDGDGIRDDVEILQGGTSPILADLPRLNVDIVGLPFISLNETVSSTKTQTGSSIQSDATENTHSYSKQMQHTVEAEASLEVKTEVGGGKGLIPSPFPSAGTEVTASVSAKYGYVDDTTYGANKTSSTALQQEVSAAEEQGAVFDSGTVLAAVSVHNDSNVSIQFDDLEVVASRLVQGASKTKSAFQPIGVLHGNEDANGFFKPIALGPQESALITVSNDELNVGPVRAFIDNPLGLNMQVGNYTMRQVGANGEVGVDYDVIFQDVVERTAVLTIDYGDGTVERHSIATNVERNPDGSAAGLTMEQVLTDVLGLPFETAVNDVPDPDPLEGPAEFGKSMLYSLDNRGPQSVTGLVYQDPDTGDFVIDDPSLPPYIADGETEQSTGTQYTRFWMVSGTVIYTEDKSELLDFEDIRLLPGQSYFLTYVTDVDADGLTFIEEQTYGTSDASKDTDGDGFGDYLEVKKGMTVRFDGNCPESTCDLSQAEVDALSYQAFSNPRFADTDGDLLLDGDERDKGTDPKLVDTDGDGIPDLTDTCTGIDCGAPPSAALKVHLACDDNSVIDFDGTKVFLDDSGLSNDAAFGGMLTTQAYVDKPGDHSSNEVLQEGIEAGYFFTQDRSGAANKAHFVMNDDLDEECHTSISIQDCFPFPPCTVCNDEWSKDMDLKGRALLSREDAATSPLLEAKAPTEGSTAGWTMSIWIASAPTGTLYKTTNGIVFYSKPIKSEMMVLSQLGPGSNDDCIQLSVMQDGTPVAKIVPAEGGTPLIVSGAPGDVPPNTWKLLTLTVENVWAEGQASVDDSDTTATLYVDAVAVDSFTRNGPVSNKSPAGPGARPLWIGWYEHLPTASPDYTMNAKRSFNGAFDDLRIYDAALAPEEVAGLAGL